MHLIKVWIHLFSFLDAEGREILELVTFLFYNSSIIYIVNEHLFFSSVSNISLSQVRPSSFLSHVIELFSFPAAL